MPQHRTRRGNRTQKWPRYRTAEVSNDAIGPNWNKRPASKSGPPKRCKIRVDNTEFATSQIPAPNAREFSVDLHGLNWQNDRWTPIIEIT
jgi:hypothetical protein